MKKESEPKIEPCGTPAKTGLHDDVYPFKKTLSSLPEKLLSRRFDRFPDIPKHLIL